MAAALRQSILRHIGAPIRTLTLENSGHIPSLRSFSSHDDHLTKEEVIERVLDVVKSFPKLDPSKVTPEAHFQKDLGLDSLDKVEIVMALEEEFKLEIPDKEADKIDSTALAIEYIANHPMAVEVSEIPDFSETSPTLRKGFSDSTSRIENLCFDDFSSSITKNLDAQAFRIFAATWNVGGNPPRFGLNFNDFLLVDDESDIYVLGFQEIVPLNAGNVFVLEDNQPTAKCIALISEALIRSPVA